MSDILEAFIANQRSMTPTISLSTLTLRFAGFAGPAELSGGASGTP